MLYKNFTPFPGNAWETVSADNKWFATTLARVKFKLIKGDDKGQWFLQLDPEQGELFAEDIFFQDNGSVRYESDYVPYKPFTDIVLNAKAHRPEAEDLKSFECGVKVFNPADKLINQQSLLVKGAHKTLFREKVDVVEIRYEKSKGGITRIKNKGKEDEEVSVDLYNPVGCGIFDLNNPKELCSVQIEYFDKPLKNVPAGFGFIHRSWKSRLDYAGTYDDDWVKNQHPLPPHDFNWFHNQAAHPNLITKSYLEPGSKIVFSNLIKNQPESYFVVPEFKFLARITTNTEKSFAKMNLDTLLIDIDYDYAENHAVYASWRSYSAIGADDAISGEVMLIPGEEQKEEAA